MQIVVTIPSEMDESLKGAFPDASLRALELLAIDGYMTGRLSHGQVGKLLGHSAWMETEAFLQREHVPLNYSCNDLENDVQTLREVFKKECPA